MVDGQIAFSAGSTVPTVEGLNVTLPPREIKPDTEETAAQQPTPTEETAADAKEDEKAVPMDVDQVVVKDEPVEPSPNPVSSLPVKPIKAELKASIMPGSLFVGDLRLANLKSRLSALSPPVPAEFAGEGILICGPGVNKGLSAKGGSIVAVRKLGEGQIVLEGGIGRTYDVVRRELYKGFARVVAA
jgi:cleavage and polyadenylation specificity factor subunit 2